MDAFDATLKRAFAEAHEPADDGFAAGVSAAVAHREKTVLTRQTLQGVLLSAGIAAAGYGLMVLTQAIGPQVLAAAGLELARAHGALGEASSFNLAAIGAGLTQMLMVLGALAGGAVLYRNAQN